MNTKKLRGWLVVNHFLQTGKFNEIYDWLLAAAKKVNCELTMYTNAQLLSYVANGRLTMLTDTTILQALDFNEYYPDFILFWDKDIRLAYTLEQLGFRLFNCAEAIATCDDKSLTFLRLSSNREEHYPMPKTILAPMTYDNIGYKNGFSFLDQAQELLSYPMVIKECFGSFGAQVYLAKKRQEAEQIIEQCNGRPLLFQEFIQSSYGRDIRIQVVGGKVIATMLRTHDSDFRANITNGGRMSKFTPSKEACDLAVRVCETLQLDFAGVDLLFGEHGEPILCEINSNAHFKNINTCTGVNVADKIMEHIITQV